MKDWETQKDLEHLRQFHAADRAFDKIALAIWTESDEIDAIDINGDSKNLLVISRVRCDGRFWECCPWHHKNMSIILDWHKVLHGGNRKSNLGSLRHFVKWLDWQKILFSCSAHFSQSTLGSDSFKCLEDNFSK